MMHKVIKMKRLYRNTFTVALTGLLLLTGILFFGARLADESRREKILLESMMKSLGMMHYNPAVMNDGFSEKVFDNYLDAQDNFRKFLIQPDIDLLAKHKTLIDEQISQGKLDFFEEVEKIIVPRIDEASEYYKEILKNPFDLSVNETIELDPEKSPWCKSREMLKDEWRKALKFQVMIRVHQELDIQETASKKQDTVVKVKTFAEIEMEAREQVRKTYEDYFDRFSKSTRADRFELYLNAISSVYDPHTNYFAPAKKDNFDISMSGKLEGIGAVLTQRGGYIQVEEIMPGSPSWKQGELKAGDLILKVAQGEAEPVDVTSMRLDDAVKLVRGKKGTEVRLTVKKKVTEEMVVIKIIRDVVEMEQTWARSAIIHTNEGKKVGYIYLPRFYADFNNPFTGRFCADDVKKEIAKLKSDGIDALLFDLRNNGGGSLSDVVTMSGFFIPTGPVVQVKDKIEGMKVLSDTDPEVQYDGPMIVLVNTGSASASEIMASALQDYKRAVVVGSPSTFGKGTVQRFFDLDVLVQGSEPGIKPLGSLKLTTQKFYRINGGATQMKGVNPDIVLPDPYMYIDFGEKDLDNAMAWSQINSVSYDPWKGPSGDVNALRSKSTKRTQTHEVFKSVEEQATMLKQQREETRETLNLDQYRAKQKERKLKGDKLNEIMEKKTGLDVVLTGADLGVIASDTIKGRLMNEWVDDLEKDAYLYEASSIMLDMLESKKLTKSSGK